MADRYGVINVTPGDPRGRQTEVIISGTPKPGTCMTVLAATEPVGGIFTYEAFNRDADADRALVGVLLEDELQGRLVTTAYVATDQARVYFPNPGDMLQMLVANISGTSDSFNIGDYMMIEDVTGKLLTTSSPEREPFVIMETIGVSPLAGITADVLVLCMFTGS